MYKKNKIIMLIATPNDETSKGVWIAKDRDWCHLFILSDEEIGTDDWYVHHNIKLNTFSLFKADAVFNEGNNPNTIDSRKYVLPYKNYKVIATTDSSLVVGELSAKLYGNRLPDIPTSFIQFYIQEYNKGKAPVDVEVEYAACMSGERMNAEFYDKLIVNSDNTINIKPIKECWTREEVIKIAQSAWLEGYDENTLEQIKANEKIIPFDKWIEENL